MSLTEYRRKRRFDKTTEPPADSILGHRSIFVVQLHHASHRHYDFRLQVGDALKSWAVPKGPSLDPSVKRLAVEVEDHPVSYADFQGDIPKGEYGAGHVAIFDRGVWSTNENAESQLAKGHLKFDLFGDVLQGKWSLIRSQRKKKQQEWLLIKQKDSFASSKEADDFLLHNDSNETVATKKTKNNNKTRSSLSGVDATQKRKILSQIKKHTKSHRTVLRQEAFTPRLCQTSSKPPSGEEWLHEIKWDGYRLLCTIVKGQPKLWSRNGIDWTEKLPDIVREVKKLGLEDAVFDGELVALEGMKSDFNLLQATLAGEAQAPLTYMVFDFIHFNGYDITNVELISRKNWLEEILVNSSPKIRYSPHLQGNGQDVFDRIATEGLEGIISKRISSSYSAGRSPDWRKIKRELSDEFAIAGFTEPKGSRVGIGSLLLARSDEKKGWKLAGRVGTGMSDKMLRNLFDVLNPEASRIPSVAINHVESDLRTAWWVMPTRIVEVFYRGLSSQGLLRHTAFKGLREDKTTKDLKIPTKKDRRTDSGSVEISSPERIVYPDTNINKKDVADYYRQVMPWLLPELAGRLVSVLRCPDGSQGKCFFQKHHTPGLRTSTVSINESKGIKEYLVVRDSQDVMELVQFNVLEFHPWGSLANNSDKCDRLVFDLDPGENVTWLEIKQAARQIFEHLEGINLTSFLRTSGGKGLHIVVPLNPPVPWDTTKEFARAFAKTLAGAYPDKYVATISKQKRSGKIFVDYLRNSRGATSVCSYSLRARPGAPVAVPLRWDELSRIKSASGFDINSLPRRLSRLKKNPWDGMENIKQGLPSEDK